MRIHLDFETASSANLRKVGAWAYSEHPTTRVLCICFTRPGIGKAMYWVPAHAQTSELFWLAEGDSTFVSFGDFERAIWTNIMVPVHGFPELPIDRWEDVQAVAAMKNLPLDLDTLTTVLDGPPKDMEGRRLTLSMSKFGKDGKSRCSTENIARVIAYCERDVAAQVHAEHCLGGLPKGERMAWEQNQLICRRGLAIDAGYVRQAKAVVAEASAPLTAEFAELTGGLKPTQREKFLGWIEAAGYELPNLQKKTVSEVLGLDPIAENYEYDGSEEAALEPIDFIPSVARALEIRHLIGNTSLAKLDAMLACCCADGRARGLLQYHGTGPGRSTGRLLQPQNFPRPTLKISPEKVRDAILTGSASVVRDVGEPLAAVVGGLRHAFIPGPGRVFVSGDYSGIQARLVLALAGQTDKVKMLAEGRDVYADMASAIYGRPIDRSVDLVEGQIGKNCVLGLGFGMGAKTFRAKMARQQTLDFCQICVDTYRKQWAPKVKELWRGLQTAATRTVLTRRPHESHGILYRIEGSWLTATVPSGSKIWYYQPRRSVKPAPWDEDVALEGFTFMAQKAGKVRPVAAFGGLLTENVIMRMEADIVQDTQYRLEAYSFPVVLDVHDELVAEPSVALKDDVEHFEDLLLDVKPWVRRLGVPVAAKCWTGDFYRKD